MRVLAVKDRGVTRGVLDKSLDFLDDLREVTFADHNGTVHTVYANVNGPFDTPDKVVAAWEAGELHDRPNDPSPEAPADAPELWRGS